MIRLVLRRLIIPRGDTGSFSIPDIIYKDNFYYDVAVLTIWSEQTNKKIYEKIANVNLDAGELTFSFSHEDTVNLPVGKYVWDIKYYIHPTFADDVLTDGQEVHSYYSAFTLPVCEIRQTGDNLLLADDAPHSELIPSSINFINSALNEINASKTQIEGWANLAQTAADLLLNLTITTTTLSSSLEAMASYDYTTGILSLGIPRGQVPNLSIGTVIEGPVADASITGTASNPLLNLTLPNANIPIKKVYGYFPESTNIAPGDSIILAEEQYDESPIPYKEWYGKGAQIIILEIIDGGDTEIHGCYLIYINSGHQLCLNLIDGNKYFESNYIPSLPNGYNANSVVYYLGEINKEIDPTVHAWAKAATKPTYTASEVGAPTVNEMNNAISNAISNVNQLNVEIVLDLPIENIHTHTIYFLNSNDTENNIYNEYMYINNNWEMIGSTQVDLSNYVLRTDYATSSVAGVVISDASLGVQVNNNGKIGTAPATASAIKDGSNEWAPLVAKRLHEAVFYGLAKAANDTTQALSNNVVGNYTNNAKSAIQTMLGIQDYVDTVAGLEVVKLI